MALMLSVTWTALAQDRKITGSVQDAKGGGIPGVSVAVKGTTTGTTTDGNGAFSINVKSGNAELVITSVGYVSKSVAVGNRLLLGITDEIIYLVLGVLIANTTTQGKDGVDVIAGLQERREIGGGVTWVTANIVGIL